jgi:alpha-L-rhamnosidase
LKPENVTAVVIHSAMEPTGTFECSDPLINQLQHNIVWGQKGNFLDVPTDCPQRDERLGWTGDAQAFCRTAAFNMDVAAFFTKWLKDLHADQLENGGVPFVIPDVLRNNGVSAGWGDAATIIPWDLYQVYGDTSLLSVQYPSMKAYVEYIREQAGDALMWKGGSVFGDWLFYKPHGNNHTAPDGYTDPDMIATMFFAHSAHLLSQAAGVLGKTEEEMEYRAVYEAVKAVFQKAYVTPSGRIASDSQTAYVLALQFGLLPEPLRAKAAAHLVDDIRGCDGFLMYRKIRILKQKEGMSARIVKQDGGKVTIEVDMELNGSMLSQEEAIQLALNEAGKLATRAAAERFDTDGTAITHKGQRLSSKGRKKS